MSLCLNFSLKAGLRSNKILFCCSKNVPVDAGRKLNYIRRSEDVINLRPASTGILSHHTESRLFLSVQNNFTNCAALLGRCIRTLSNIYEGTFCGICYQLLPLTVFAKRSISDVFRFPNISPTMPK